MISMILMNPDRSWGSASHHIATFSKQGLHLPMLTFFSDTCTRVCYDNLCSVHVSSKLLTTDISFIFILFQNHISPHPLKNEHHDASRLLHFHQLTYPTDQKLIGHRQSQNCFSTLTRRTTLQQPLSTPELKLIQQSPKE